MSNAVHVMRSATEVEEATVTSDGKNVAAVQLGSRGGRARADNLSKRRKREIATKAAKARWRNSKRSKS
jgi:hypothetical protein